MKCSICNSFSELKIFRKEFLTKSYKCQSCVKIGIDNPFQCLTHIKTLLN